MPPITDRKSIVSPACVRNNTFAEIAQSIEHYPSKLGVAGLSPVFRSLNEVVTKVATFFILWFFVVWGHLFKPRFKPTLAMNASISVVCYKSKILYLNQG